MSNEELIKQYRLEEDAYKKELIRNDFFKANNNFAHHIAKKYSNSNISLEDRYSIAMFGMIKAFNTFKLEKKVKFTSYAGLIMHNEILMAMRKSKKYKDDLSLESPIEGTDDTLLLGDMVACDTDVEDMIMRNQVLVSLKNSAKDAMSDKEYKAFINEFSDHPKSQKELAKELGVSQSYVSRLVTSGLVKLRRGLNA